MRRVRWCCSGPLQSWFRTNGLFDWMLCDKTLQVGVGELHAVIAMRRPYINTARMVNKPALPVCLGFPQGPGLDGIAFAVREASWALSSTFSATYKYVFRAAYRRRLRRPSKCRARTYYMLPMLNAAFSTSKAHSHVGFRTSCLRWKPFLAARKCRQRRQRTVLPATRDMTSCPTL